MRLRPFLDFCALFLFCFWVKILTPSLRNRWTLADGQRNRITPGMTLLVIVGKIHATVSINKELKLYLLCTAFPSDKKRDIDSSFYNKQPFQPSAHNTNAVSSTNPYIKHIRYKKTIITGCIILTDNGIPCNAARRTDVLPTR